MQQSLDNYYGTNYNEAGRLTRDRAHSVEFLTTIHTLDRILAPKSAILDACAGTGPYAFHLAAKTPPPGLHGFMRIISTSMLKAYEYSK